MKKKIDPSHIWEIRDELLDTTAKALLVRLAGLQHLTEIWVSNATLAQDLDVSRRTIIEKMKVLVKAGYISERLEVNEATQTKFTELSLEWITKQILCSTKGSRKSDLERYYTAGRENCKKRPLPATESSPDRASRSDTEALPQLEKLERDIHSGL